MKFLECVYGYVAIRTQYVLYFESFTLKFTCDGL